MSYLHSHADSATRAKAAVLVGGIHAIIGTVLVAGLTFTYLDKQDKDFIAIKFTDPPEAPPTDPVDPTPIESAYVAPTVLSPPIPISTNTPIEITPVDLPLVNHPIDVVTIPRPTTGLAPLPPTPTPTFAPAAPSPINGPAGWITNADYPGSALRREDEGTASYRLVVGSDGRVDACEITASAGTAALDQATCRLIERRARFEAATDPSGRQVVGTFTGQVTWQIPD